MSNFAKSKLLTVSNFPAVPRSHQEGTLLMLLLRFTGRRCNDRARSFKEYQT